MTNGKLIKTLMHTVARCCFVEIFKVRAGFDLPRGMCPYILMWAHRFFRLGALNVMYDN